MDRKQKISRKQIYYFNRIPFRFKLIAFEAFLTMAISRFYILFIPFRRVATRMGKPMHETTKEIDSERLTYARQIAWMIEKVSNYTPWESKCLVRALTGQKMLKKRKIPSTLYLGVKKENVDGLSAHAWLRCGNFVILGGKERSGYTTVAYFGAD